MELFLTIGRKLPADDEIKTGLNLVTVHAAGGGGGGGMGVGEALRKKGANAQK